ncbi:hypothetical protein HML84_12235 [Alcanivorax sp. IO_7]|nr:hypothetical protein HML84_12235 [Alcanivorax sp. IO_7]
MDRLNIEDRFQIERLTLVLRHLRHAFSMSVMVATLMVAVFYFSSDSVVSAVSAISGERIGIRTAAVSTTALLVWYFALLAVSGRNPGAPTARCKTALAPLTSPDPAATGAWAVPGGHPLGRLDLDRYRPAHFPGPPPC